MANAITLNSQLRDKEQFGGAFTDMWRVKATISDQDAVSAGDTASFSLTVSGVVLGDIVLGISVDEDLSDGTDQAVLTGIVSAANTVLVRVNADVGEFAADNLNGKVVKMFIGRPNW